jgi:hypothetical protein
MVIVEGHTHSRFQTRADALGSIAVVRSIEEPDDQRQAEDDATWQWLLDRFDRQASPDSRMNPGACPRRGDQ